MTFFSVQQNEEEPEPVIRPGVADVSDFLVAHVESLQERATKGLTPNASFITIADEDLMSRLASGTDDEFLAAARVLGIALIAEMDARTAPGLLLCTSLQGADGSAVAAVLKLEIVAEQGAVIRVVNGEETLAAVTDVLDKPGELQKGLVYPDARPASRAVVGDLSAGVEARYFLRSLKVVLEAKPSGTAAALVKEVQKLTTSAVATRVAAALPKVSAGSTGAVLAALGKTVPELNPQVVTDLTASLGAKDRPVRQIDTQAPIKGRIYVGPLLITGPAAEIAAVTWDRDTQGGWVVTLRSDHEPTRDVT